MTNLARLLTERRRAGLIACPSAWTYRAIATRAGVKYGTMARRWERGTVPVFKSIPQVAKGYCLPLATVLDAAVKSCLGRIE